MATKNARVVGPRKLVLLAPAVLGMAPRHLPRALAYLQSIREAAAAGESVEIDLRGCRHVSPAMCLMLCAELERCQRNRRGSVSGYDPLEPAAAQILHRFRFHQHLGFQDRLPRRPNSNFLRIKAGETVRRDTPEQLKHVAEIAGRGQSDRFIEEVLQSLLEALFNITGHAYEGLDDSECLHGRWWLAGVAQGDKLKFYAYDQGVGVAKRAPHSMAVALAEYAAQGNRLHSSAFAHGRQRDVLEAACRARRLGIDVGGEGKGFPEMVSLIEKHGVNGQLDVVSRGARYTFRKREGATSEASMGLQTEAPGTLIAWTIARPNGSKSVA